MLTTLSRARARCVHSAQMSKQRKFTPRTRNRFRERELARAVRAARAAGGERVEIDPATGKISVILAKPGEGAADNEVENWLSKQKGQHANQR
jgi:hypothetical protein